MARNRIKVHPFGYKKIKEAKKEFGHSVGDVQVVTMILPYEVGKKDKTGKQIYRYETDILGKKKRIPIMETFHNTVHKVVYHNAKPKRGRTLADMVYESYNA